MVKQTPILYGVLGGFDMLGGLGLQEMLVIGAILAVLFGATRLPKIGKGLGEGIRNFKIGLKELRKPADDLKQLEKDFDEE